MNKLKTLLFIFILNLQSLTLSEQIDIRYLDHISKCLCIGEIGVTLTVNSKIKVKELKEIISKEHKCDVKDLEVVSAMNFMLTSKTKCFEDNLKLKDAPDAIWVINTKNKCPNNSDEN